MSAEAQQVRILVVDDDRQTLDFLSDQLGSRGFGIETAMSGGQAVELASRHHFDVAICDLKMPLMDGITCLETMTHLSPSLQVIMISGEATVDKAVQAMKKGAYDFLQKPVRMEVLLTLIDKALLKGKLDAISDLYEKSRSILSQLDVQELLEPALKNAVLFFRAHAAGWVEFENNSTRLLCACGADEEGARKGLLETADSALRESLNEKGPLLKSRSIAIPLVGENGPGAMFVMNRKESEPNFTLSDLREAAALAGRLMRTVELSRLQRSLDHKISDLRRLYSELQESKDQLDQKQKMAGIGGALASVAHEISDPLSAVIGYAELLLGSGELNGRTRERLELILHESERCRNMVCEIMDYSRMPEPCFRWMRLQNVVLESLRVFELELQREHIQVELTLPAEPLGLSADADQLKQVLSNLLQNAVYALRGRRERKIRIEASGNAEHVRLSVRDSGQGIGIETLKNMFGLGLSVVSDIVRAHHGTVSVQSAPGKGACFVIELPVSQPDFNDSLDHAA